MSADEVRSFAHYICNLNEGKKSGIWRIDSINETENGATQLAHTLSIGWTIGTSLTAAMIYMESRHTAESPYSRPR